MRSADPRYYSPVNREEVLMLSDLLMDDRGLVPFGADAATHALMGRFGNVLLVNGDDRATRSTSTAARSCGSIVTNAASARIYNLSFPAAERV